MCGSTQIAENLEHVGGPAQDGRLLWTSRYPTRADKSGTFYSCVIGRPMDHSDSAADSPSISREEMISIRRRLQEQFAAVPLAYSTDGKTFGFEAPLDSPLPAGSYVRIRTSEDGVFLGQIISKSIDVREGPELAIDVGNRFNLALEGTHVSQARIRPQIRFIQGQGVILGKVSNDALEIPRPTDVFQDGEMTSAPASLINSYLSGSSEDSQVQIGIATYGDESSVASLHPKGFTRHSFLCGQSGSGKTYSLGVVLERMLLSTGLRLIIIDPNSDFVRLPSLRGDVNRHFHADDIGRYESISRSISVLCPTAGNGTARLAVGFGDLARQEQALVLQLDPLDDREEYGSFWRIIDQLGQTNVELSDVLDAAVHDSSAESRQISLRVRNLGISDWTIWCRQGERSIVDHLSDDWRAMVVDIGTLGLPAEKQVVTLALLSQLWRQRETRQPVLIVMDEAHNICPAEPESALQELLTQYVIRIAGEGRKFGLYLLLCSQRPQKIHPNVLSQCDNLVLMRMNSSADLEYLSNVFSFVPRDMLWEASNFRQGESLVAGALVKTPTFVRFGRRMTNEGGGDVPTSWTVASGDR
jgi:hypothetical protein